MWLAAVDEDDNEFAEEVGDDDIGRKIRNTMILLGLFVEGDFGRERKTRIFGRVSDPGTSIGREGSASEISTIQNCWIGLIKIRFSGLFRAHFSKGTVHYDVYVCPSSQRREVVKDQCLRCGNASAECTTWRSAPF